MKSIKISSLRQDEFVQQWTPKLLAEFVKQFESLGSISALPSPGHSFNNKQSMREFNEFYAMLADLGWVGQRIAIFPNRHGKLRNLSELKSGKEVPQELTRTVQLVTCGPNNFEASLLLE
jgi:hypothetical protein